jgi:hypothetical protein
VSNSATMRGGSGEVRWSYHRAASLGSWTMTIKPGESTLTASVLTSDAFKVSQQPLTFVVPRPNGKTWRWPVTVLQISGNALTASLGPREE